MILLLWIYLLISSFMISTIKIYRQCYYCWRRYCHYKPSNFAIQRRTARPTLDVIIKYKKLGYV